MSTDADRFAADDTKHDLCDMRPCYECKKKMLRAAKDMYYARKWSLEDCDDYCKAILEELNAKGKEIAKKHNRSFKPYHAKDIW